MVRTPIYVRWDANAYNPIGAVGGVLVNDKAISGPAVPAALITRGTVSGTAVIPNWDAPKYLPSSNTALLKVASSNPLFYANISSVANLAGSAGGYPGPRWINFDGLMYGISLDAATSTTDTNNNYTVWKTNLLTLPASMVAGTAPTITSGPPLGGFDLIGYQSRIWMLGGCDTPGGNTAHSCTTLFFTNPISSGGGTTAADWKDPVSGLTNQIKMDNNIADYGVGLGTVRNGLVIFRANSTWLLRGSTSANYSLTPISKQFGCIDARSIVSTDRGIYFLSNAGLMLTDGTSVKNVSGPVTHTLQRAIQYAKNYLGNGGCYTYAFCHYTAQGFIFISIGANYLNTNSMQPTWSAYYDVSTGAWSRFTSPVYVGDATQDANGLNNYPSMLLGNMDHGWLCSVGDRWITQIEMRDLTGSFGVDSGMTQSALYDMVDKTPHYKAVPAVWGTRFAPIIGTTTLTRKFGQMKRYFVDQNFGAAVAASPSPKATGFSVSPVDATGAAVLGQLNNLPLTSVANVSDSVSGGGITPSTAITRTNIDFPPEISDIAFKLAWTDSNQQGAPPLGTVSEIYGVGLEFQPTRDLR